MPTEDKDNKSKRRQLNKFSDKGTLIMRRDLVLPAFDRTLIIEKTHFENEESVKEDNIEVVVDTCSPPLQTMATSISAPNLPIHKKTAPLKNDINQSNSRNKKPLKKQSKASMHGTASPAEVFHRNLVDAVSNVEDSDENEHYVYPYSGNESSTTTGLHRPISVRSITSSLLHDKKKSQGIGDWLRQALYNKSTQTLVEDEEEDMYSSNNEYYRRPRLRNHLRDHSHNRSSLLNLWRDTALPFKKPRKSLEQNTTAHGGYTSDDEDAPLLSRRQKRFVSKNNKKSCQHKIHYVIMSGLFMLVMILSLIVYKAQPITNLSVDMDRVLATDKELIFDLKVQADNWNWWTIHVTDADISLFAFSQIVPTNLLEAPKIIRGADPAEYLGSLTHFDEPLSLTPYLFTHRASESITQIRIKSPGADTSGNERWSRMIRYPYGLVIRGVLRYKLIPFMVGTYPQSVAICNVTQVDPITGTVSSDLDKTVCNGQDESQPVDFSHASWM